ncbi:hypothetical protein C8Q72DRAFT_488279 [Fomitopsis betulina]|nr:hypothetical protein C8Q72DRAFT_488279 [Fomitopsis betulina]
MARIPLETNPDVVTEIFQYLDPFVNRHRLGPANQYWAPSLATRKSLLHVLHLHWGTRRDGFQHEVVAHAASRYHGRPLLPTLRLTLVPGQAIDRVVTTFLPPTIVFLDIQAFYPTTIDVEGRDTNSQGITYVLQHVPATCLYIEEIKTNACGGWEQVLLLSGSSHLRHLTVSRPLNSNAILDSRVWKTWAQMTSHSSDIRPPPSLNSVLTFLHRSRQWSCSSSVARSLR